MSIQGVTPQIEQMVIARYHDGDASTFSGVEFSIALQRGVESGRFFKVRESYFLANKKNEAYDPRSEQKWLENENFNERQTLAHWVAYNHEFGLHEDEFEEE